MEKKPQSTEAAIAPRYTADDWENDPFLKPNPERQAKVSAEQFATLRTLGVRTSQVRDPQTKKSYIEYLRKVEAT